MEVKQDSRGWLAEILRVEDTGAHQFGQIIVSTAYPGQTKGNHYHLRKREWYCVIKGKAKLTVVDRRTRESTELVMEDVHPVVVEIPVGTLHWISNIGASDMYLLTYTDESFDLNDPDTFYEK
ncbi:MAG: WxcM-like domain-containing protein [Nitrososphaerota archaeon]|nr:WxcM-like domain-containing protein [Nitrososphaerota archaeon]